MLPCDDNEQKGRKCGYCKGSVVQATVCGQCRVPFHTSCLKRHRGCGEEPTGAGRESEVKNLVEENEILKIEVTLLTQLVRKQEEKNNVMWENNLLLKEKIKYLEGKNEEHEVIHVQVDATSITEEEKIKSMISEQRDGNSNTSAKKPESTNTNKSKAANSRTYSKVTDQNKKENQKSMLIYQQATMADVIGLGKLDNIPPKNTKEMEWTQVKRKSNKTRRAVVGEKPVSETEKTLKGCPRKAFLYVSRLHPETESQDVVDFLKDDFPEVVVEKLVSKFPEHYAAFKVTIDLTHLEGAMNATIWPYGTFVTRFFHTRRKENPVG